MRDYVEQVKERLTEKRNGKNVIPLRMAVCGVDLPYWSITGDECDLERFVGGDAADRLAAYEDTGLEPEEVEHTKNALAGKSLAEIKEINGLSVQRMIELAQAEQEGRLVVLPCKPDATFYRIVGVSIAISCFEGVYVDSGGNITYCCGVGDWIDASDIGKSVFLTRAEAEKAMEEAQDA